MTEQTSIVRDLEIVSAGKILIGYASSNFSGMIELDPSSQTSRIDLDDRIVTAVAQNQDGQVAVFANRPRSLLLSDEAGYREIATDVPTIATDMVYRDDAIFVASPLSAIYDPLGPREAAINQFSLTGEYVRTLFYPYQSINCDGCQRDDFNVNSLTSLENGDLLVSYSVNHADFPSSMIAQLSQDGTVKQEWRVADGTVMAMANIPEQGAFDFSTTPQVLNSNADIDLDGFLTAHDIDLLSQAIRENSIDLAYDVNNSGGVNNADRSFLVRVVFDTHFGDSNLDGVFNSSDFINVFQAGEYEDNIAGNSTWQTGDWNGDGDFSAADFILAFQSGGYFRETAISAVPEPNPTASTASLVCGALVILLRRNRATQNALP